MLQYRYLDMNMQDMTMIWLHLLYKAVNLFLTKTTLVGQLLVHHFNTSCWMLHYVSVTWQ